MLKASKSRGYLVVEPNLAQMVDFAAFITAIRIEGWHQHGALLVQPPPEYPRVASQKLETLWLSNVFEQRVGNRRGNASAEIFDIRDLRVPGMGIFQMSVVPEQLKISRSVPAGFVGRNSKCLQ